MNKKTRVLQEMYDELIEARDAVEEAKKELHDAEYNHLFGTINALRCLIDDTKGLDFSEMSYIMKGHFVTFVRKTKDNIAITLEKDNYTEEELLSDEFTDEELSNLAILILKCAIDSSEEKSDDKVENTQSDKSEEKKTPNIPLVTEKTVINEDIFWSTINMIKWNDILQVDQYPIFAAKEIIRKLGYNEKQIKELRDIFTRLQNELITVIKQNYSESDFVNSDFKLTEISDHIISLGEETYVDIFNSIDDLLPYTTEPHTKHMIYCFN